MRGQHVLGAIFFVLSINHKHMLLYFAPAFFFYLLGTCFLPVSTGDSGTVATDRTKSKVLTGEHGATELDEKGRSRWWRGVLRVAGLGVAVVMAFAAVWAPFLAHGGVALQVRDCCIELSSGQTSWTLDAFFL
jgi:hypothetical protein